MRTNDEMKTTKFFISFLVRKKNTETKNLLNFLNCAKKSLKKTLHFFEFIFGDFIFLKSSEIYAKKNSYIKF